LFVQTIQPALVGEQTENCALCTFELSSHSAADWTGKNGFYAKPYNLAGG
jgi:hypothetical protein